MLPSDYLKQGWCQGSYAVDKDGNFISEQSDQAVAWCFFGACWRIFKGSAVRNSPFSEYTTKARAILQAIYPGFISLWNDTKGRTQAEVVSLAERVEHELGLA